MLRYRLTNPPGRGLPGFGDAEPIDLACPVCGADDDCGCYCSECDELMGDCICCPDCGKHPCRCPDEDLDWRRGER